MQAVGEGTGVDKAGRHGANEEGADIERSHCHPGLPGALAAESGPRCPSKAKRTSRGMTLQDHKPDIWLGLGQTRPTKAIRQGFQT